MSQEPQRDRAPLPWSGTLPGPATMTACWSPLAEREHRVICMTSHIGGSVPPHMHARHHVGVVEQGSAIVQSEGRQWTVQPGDLIWHVPRQMHSISSASCRCRWVAADEEMVEQMMSAFGTRVPDETRVFSETGLGAVFRELHRSLERGAVTHAAADTLAAIIAALSGARASSGVLAPLLGPEVERCRVAIRNSYAEQIRLSDLARIAGMSLYHLARKFAGALCVPPHTYLLHLRASWAQTLLRRGLSGSRVAYEVGFSDQSHCIRVHRRLLGLSPFALLAVEEQLPVKAGDWALLSESTTRAAAAIWQP